MALIACVYGYKKSPKIGFVTIYPIHQNIGYFGYALTLKSASMSPR